MTYRALKEQRERHAPAVCERYAEGEGHKAIAVALGLKPTTVRKVLIEQGVYQPGKIKRLSGGPNGKDAVRIQRLNGVVRRMRARVKKCLDKKPPQKLSITHGMSHADAFRTMYHADAGFLLMHLIRRRIRKVITHGVKRGRSLELLGCNESQFKAHIESRFKRGMTWENYGTGAGRWHLDHIIPCAVFDLTKEAEQRACFHWTNYQPLWSLENSTKRAQVTHPQQFLLLNVS